MATFHQLSLWSPAAAARPDEQARLPPPPSPNSGQGATGASAEPHAVPAGLRDERPPLPRSSPLRSAIDAGFFGITAVGPVVPDTHEVAAVTLEHAADMLRIAVEAQQIREAIRTGIDPRTGQVVRPEALAVARESWQAALEQLNRDHSGVQASFEKMFGADAAAELDAWINGHVARIPTRPPYDIGHPWHYYHAGDNAAPLPFEQIPAAEDAGRWLERDLPKNPAKRKARLREVLAADTARLADDRRRYEDILARGVDALSAFDREIAYGGNDALALSSTIALKVSHIRVGLCRVAWLKEQLDRERRWEPIHAASTPSADETLY